MCLQIVIIIFILGLCIGDAMSERENYNYFKRLAEQGFFKDIAINTCCAKLAEKLEIQADGGDDPAEFVKWAVDQCWREAGKSDI